MIKTTVTYASEYGSTEVYAKWLAESLGVQAVSIKSAAPAALKESALLIFGGGLYASGIKGIKAFRKKAGNLEHKSAVIFTVGLSDPADTDYSEILKKNFTEAERRNMVFFHLRGAINYKKLSAVHRIMMAMMLKMVKDDPEGIEKNAEFIETYGKAVDFTDRGALAPILQYIERLPQ